VTYGLEDGADIQAVHLQHSPQGAVFDVVFNLDTPFMRSAAQRHPEMLTPWRGLRLPLHGRHNVQNSLVTVALALELGLDFATVHTTLASFAGVQRRFTQIGQVGGITIIDDYAHHPAEISAVLAAARFAVDQGRVIAVFQPHRYSRLADLMDEFARCFAAADELILAPVYSAGEPPIPGVSTERLRQKIIEHCEQQDIARKIRIVADEGELAEVIAEFALPQDFVVCMGAGSISRWAHKLPQALAESLALRAIHAQHVQSRSATHHGTEA
jgi:UDP-N-acetylmuramate--alanine ligase